MKKAVFLDRDGTINADRGYIFSVDNLYLYRWSYPAIRMLNEAGYKVVVVTNQAGVARGLLTEDILQEIHDAMILRLSRYGARIDAIYYSIDPPFKPSDTRKPAPGMVFQAVEDLDIDLSSSYVIGDKVEDLLLAKNSGCRGILVKTGYGAGLLKNFPDKILEAGPVYVAEDLADAVLWITGKKTKKEMEEEFSRSFTEVKGMLFSLTSLDFSWDELKYFVSIGFDVIIEVGGALSVYEIETAHRLGVKGISLAYIDGLKNIDMFLDVMRGYQDMRLFVSPVNSDIDITNIEQIEALDGLIVYERQKFLSETRLPVLLRKGVFLVDDENREIDALQETYRFFKDVYFPHVKTLLSS